MDADTIVVGSLAEVVRRAASTDTIAAWPAWQPPPGLDWAGFFAGRGLAYPSRGIVYSGYAMSFMSPKEGPPYFNYGFVAASRRRIEAIATTSEADMDYVWRTSNKS